MRARTLARRYTLQILYQLDVTNDRIDRILSRFWRQIENSEGFQIPEDIHSQAKRFATVLVNGTLEHLSTIDEAITDCAEDWDIHRMPIVDRCILRFATYELFYLVDIQPAVTINEAIELAKRFSTEESPKFINAVLDKVKDLEDVTRIEHL